MRLYRRFIYATVITLLLTSTQVFAGGMPWDNGNWGGNSMPWGGGNNWSPWGGNNNWAPWSNNNSKSNKYRNYNRYRSYSPYGYSPNSYAPYAYNNPYRSNSYRNYKRKKKSNWMPFDGGPWGDWSGPWDSGPWNPNWSRGTWGSDEDFWGAGPKGWTDPNDPKGSMSRLWDDMLNAPYEFGEMPGGWTAPSISVPNPVEVGDEFEGSSRTAPKEAAEQMNNFQYN